MKKLLPVDGRPDCRTSAEGPFLDDLAALLCGAAGILTVPAFITQAVGNLVFLSDLSTFRNRYRGLPT